MSTFEPLLTPATYAGSEYGMSQPDKQRKWADVNGKSRRWSFSTPQQLKELRLHQSQSPLGGTDFGADVPGDDDNEATTAHRKPRKTRNVVKRAIHKIGKLKKREPAPPPIADTAPPKIEELGINPRLLEKWKERKSLKKQGDTSPRVRSNVASPETATLVFKGLSIGSFVWLRDRARLLQEQNGFVVAALVVALAVGISSFLILSRCS